MRIAYVCQYHGPDLIASRGINRNRTLGGNRKIEMIAEVLTRAGHEVVVLSGGTPADRTMRRYRGFESTVGGRPDGARVIYASGWDAPLANLIVATGSTVRAAVKEAGRGFDVILLYNITEFTVTVAAALRRQLGDVPIVLEYEDSVDMSSRGISGVRNAIWRRLERWVKTRTRGVLAVNDLLPARIGCSNALVLRGLVSDRLCERGAMRNRPLTGDATPLAFFSGSLVAEKGLGRLIELIPRFEGRVRFAVSGAGPLEPMLREAAARHPASLEMLGLLSRGQLDEQLLSADILLNPHDDDSGAIFPFKVIEYLVAGGIVVTTRCGIAHDPAFEFCEMATTDAFGDALERVLANADHAAERAARGQAWASSLYSEESVGRRIVSVVGAAARAGDAGGSSH